MMDNKIKRLTIKNEDASSHHKTDILHMICGLQYAQDSWNSG